MSHVFELTRNFRSVCTLHLPLGPVVDQNRIFGRDTEASTSVERLTSRQWSASRLRVASASCAFRTASLPSRRWKGRCSLDARRRITWATFSGSLTSFPQYDFSAETA